MANRIIYDKDYQLPLARVYHVAGGPEPGWYYRFEDGSGIEGPFDLALDAGEHCRAEMIRRAEERNG